MLDFLGRGTKKPAKRNGFAGFFLLKIIPR